MNFTRTQAILLGVAALLLAVAAFAGGRACVQVPEPIIIVDPGGVDAGPGEREIASRLDASLQAQVARIEQIEEKFGADMAAFDARQRDEYEALRGGDDLEAAAAFLSQWSRTRRGDGGP